MKFSAKGFVSVLLLICMLASFCVPMAWAEAQTSVVYDFDQGSNSIYKKLNDMAVALQGGDALKGYQCTIGIHDRYNLPQGEKWAINWTYEATCAGLRGVTSEAEHLPNVKYVKIMRDYGFRLAWSQDEWFAIRIKSPGSGEYAVNLDLAQYSDYASAGTLAVYILPAEGEASLHKQTILNRAEWIAAATDPDNRVGTYDMYDENGDSQAANAFIGNWNFEADKEYIVVFEIYEEAPLNSRGYTCFKQMILTPGAGEADETANVKWPNSVTVLENAVPASDGGYMGALWEVDGHDYYFLPIEGGKMVIFDLDKFAAGEDPLVDTVDTSLYYPTSATVTKDGKVVVGGDGKRVFVFDTKTMSGWLSPDMRLTSGLEHEGHVVGVHAGTDGKIYFGTGYGGHMVQFDIATKTYLDLGDVVCKEVQQMAIAGITDENAEDSGEVSGIAYHNGFVYGNATCDNYSLIVKYDMAAGKVVGAIDVTTQLLGAGEPRSITVLGDKYLLSGATGMGGMVLIDIATFTLVTYEQAVGEKGLFDGPSSEAADAWTSGVMIQGTEEVNGKQYFVVQGCGLYSYDVATGKMAFVCSGSNGFRTGAKTTVTLKLDGYTEERLYLFTYAGGGQPRLYDPVAGKRLSYNNLMKEEYGIGGSSIGINTWYDDVLYIGAWNNWNCVAYDTGAEAVKSRYVTGGQTDSQTYYVDESGNFHLISGNYSCCVVYEIDPDNKTGYAEDSNVIKPLIANMSKYEQKRIHTVATGDGYVFAGTIPTSYKHGGGVGVYNIETGTEDFVRFKEKAVYGEKTVPNQELWDLSVKGLAYTDGVLYGATSRSGGSGTGYSAGTSAHIFAFDYKNMEVLSTLDLREHLTLVDANGDGVEDPVDFIGGISADPVIEGRLWGIVADVVFTCTFDRNTGTWDVQEVVSLNISEYETSGGVGSKNREVVFDPENNQVFVSLCQTGLRCIKVTDWESATYESNRMIMTMSPKSYALGANDNLYYSDGEHLRMIPVNLKEDDWTRAAQVDAQIEAIGKVTLETADAVEAAWAAYDALSLRDKALVQNIRILQEAEAELLEQRIALALASVSAESVEELSRLLLEYNKIPERQKKYVKNYTALEEAYKQAIALRETEEANRVQQQILALTVVTLEDEAAVIAARAAYEALSLGQKELVNTEKLLAAEQKLQNIKNAMPAQYTYDFKLYDNENFMNGTVEAGGPAISTGYQNEDGTPKDNNLYSAKAGGKPTGNWFFGAYRTQINWAPEAFYGTNMDNNLFKDAMVTAASRNGLRVDLNKTTNGWGAFRIFVPSAGEYQISLSCFGKIPNLNVYILSTQTGYQSGKDRETIYTIPEKLTEAALIGTVGSSDLTATVTESWNCPVAGDYIIVFQKRDTNRLLYLDTLQLNKNLSDENAVARVGDTNFENLEGAIAYQVTTGGEKVLLLKELQVTDLVLSGGAVLDLNGYALTADSVLTYASAHIIDSSADNTGVLKITDAEGNMLSEHNSQLPLYDEKAGGYRFFGVEVKTVAVTGKENPKYWFTVEFANFDPVYELICAGAAMDIKALLNVNGEEGEAVANREFVKKWADAYKEKGSVYITVSALNTEAADAFSLIPAISANGVTIKFLFIGVLL